MEAIGEARGRLPLPGVWRRSLWRAAGAALIGPVAVAGVVLVLALGGGFTGLGSFSEVFSGPAPSSSDANATVPPHQLGQALAALAAAGSRTPTNVGAPAAAATATVVAGAAVVTGPTAAHHGATPGSTGRHRHAPGAPGRTGSATTPTTPAPPSDGGGGATGAVQKVISTVGTVAGSVTSKLPGSVGTTAGQVVQSLSSAVSGLVPRSR